MGWDLGTAGEIVVKSQYMNCMKDNTKWYWGKTATKQYHFSHTHNCASILRCHHHHWSKESLKNVCDKIQALKAIQKSSIYLTDYGHDFILERHNLIWDKSKCWWEVWINKSSL